MRVHLVFAAIICLARGDLPTFIEDLSFNCREANDLIDKAVTNSNFDIKTNGEDNMLVDYYGFDTNVNLYVFGWKLPITISLSISSGNLTGTDTLKRSNDVADCSTPISRTLEGIFEYGPQLSLKYDNAKAKFLFLEAEGKFAFKPKPKIHVALFNGTFDCRFESINTETPGPTEYVFETGNSWKGWLISKLLTRGLQQNDGTSLRHQVDLWCQGQIAAYFTKAWCALDFGSTGQA